VPRPVVGERLEEDEVVVAQRLVERVLDDGAAQAAAAVLLERVDVLDLRDAVAAAQLAIGRDLPAHDSREVAQRYRAGDATLRLDEPGRELLVAPRLAERRLLAHLRQVLERELANQGRVDAPVEDAPVRHHEVPRLRPAELLEVRGKPRAAAVDDDSAVKEVRLHVLGLARERPRAAPAALDAHEVHVVDVVDRR
jgi:hypothetical protein